MKDQYLRVQEVIETLRKESTKKSLREASIIELTLSKVKELTYNPNTLESSAEMERYYDQKAQLNYNIVVGWANSSDNPIAKLNRPRYSRKYQTARNMALQLRGGPLLNLSLNA